MKVSEGLMVVLGLTLPVAANKIVLIARKRLLAPTFVKEVIFRGAAITAGGLLAFFGSSNMHSNAIFTLLVLFIKAKGIEMNIKNIQQSSPSNEKVIDPCEGLWLERLPDIKKRIWALKVFAFANQKDIIPYISQWDNIEKLLADPKKNRNKLVEMTRKLSDDLSRFTLSQLENPLPNR